tara:strand:- start:605 stop:871 length:267 start_codon:yes stop_codon:yes gene_type:complete
MLKTRMWRPHISSVTDCVAVAAQGTLSTRSFTFARFSSVLTVTPSTTHLMLTGPRVEWSPHVPPPVCTSTWTSVTLDDTSKLRLARLL